MSGFKNLYEILGISPLATPEKIQAALKNAAQSGKITLEDAQYIQKFLLDAETRKKYDAKLFAEFPEVLQQIIGERASEQAISMVQPKKKPATYDYLQNYRSSETTKNTLADLRSGKRSHLPNVKKPFLALNSKLTPMYNEASGEMKTSYVGFSIAPIVLGIFSPLLVGDAIGFLVSFGIAIVFVLIFGSFGHPILGAWVVNIILCFVYCNNYTKRLLRSGFKLAGDDLQNKQAADLLKVKLTPNNTIND